MRNRICGGTVRARVEITRVSRRGTEWEEGTEVETPYKRMQSCTIVALTRCNSNCRIVCVVQVVYGSASATYNLGQSEISHKSNHTLTAMSRSFLERMRWEGSRQTQYRLLFFILIPAVVGLGCKHPIICAIKHTSTASSRAAVIHR